MTLLFSTTNTSPYVRVYYNQFIGTGTVSWVQDADNITPDDFSPASLTFGDVDGSLDILYTDFIKVVTGSCILV